jgi:hypothetical protein
MLLTTEMDFWRRSAGSSRRERIRNERIRDIMKVNTTIVENIRTNQLRWYEHVVRMERERLPKQVLLWTGKKKKRKAKTKLDRRHTRGVETKRTKNNVMTEDSGKWISDDAVECCKPERYRCPQKKRRVHSSLIYRRILIVYTPNQMVVSRLQNGLINSRIAPRASRLNCQNIFFSNRITYFFLVILIGILILKTTMYHKYNFT